MCIISAGRRCAWRRPQPAAVRPHHPRPVCHERAAGRLAAAPHRRLRAAKSRRRGCALLCGARFSHQPPGSFRRSVSRSSPTASVRRYSIVLPSRRRQPTTCCSSASSRSSKVWTICCDAMPAVRDCCPRVKLRVVYQTGALLDPLPETRGPARTERLSGVLRVQDSRGPGPALFNGRRGCLAQFG